MSDPAEHTTSNPAMNTLAFMDRLLTGIGQAKRDHIGARRDGEKLLTIDAVRRRSSGDDIARVEMPQRLSGLRVENAHLAKLLRGKHDPSGSRQQSRTIMIRPHGLVVPHSLTGKRVNRSHVRPPGRMCA